MTSSLTIGEEARDIFKKCSRNNRLLSATHPHTQQEVITLHAEDSAPSTPDRVQGDLCPFSVQYVPVIQNLSLILALTGSV